MSAPIIHAQSSVRKWGGTVENYLPIHELMDSTKGAFADNRHRHASHNIWFVQVIIPKIFGHEAINSNGRKYIPKEVAEQHILEDYHGKFIPTLQDWAENIEFQPWMNNGQDGYPNSFRKIAEKRKTKVLQSNLNPNTVFVDGSKPFFDKKENKTENNLPVPDTFKFPGELKD